MVEAVGRVVADVAAAVRPGNANRAHLDLIAANRQQLRAAGVPLEQIFEAGHCTACESDTFFSHRALGTPSGRFAVAAGIR